MPCNRTPGTGPTIANSFTNWAQTVTASPQSFFQPGTLDELVAIVKQAEASAMSVRAIGSGWSFTDIMVSPDFMVDTTNLNNILSETMSGSQVYTDFIFNSLTAAAKANRKLCHVQAGIKIHHLYNALEGIPGGPMLNDGPGGAPQQHGWAVKTLGGSGGQSIVGAFSTSVHGGDDHDSVIPPSGGSPVAGDPIKPLPDMVVGIYLVAAGGREIFIQRGGDRAIVDPGTLQQLNPCVAGPGQIITSDEVFNALVVSMGRMGIIYSVVLEVRPQYFLSQTISMDNWMNLSSRVLLNQTLASGGSIADLRGAHRFLQVVVLPYGNSSGSNDCFVTTRDEMQPTGPGNSGGGFNFFNYLCERPSWVIDTALVGILAVLSITDPFAEAALFAAVIAMLSGANTIGDMIAATENILTQDPFGYGFGVASGIVNFVLGSAFSAGTVTDVSFRIMDTYDYRSQCFKAKSLEVAFDADATTYVDFVNTVLTDVQTLAAQQTLVGGYISLRYCAGSDALLAMEQWPHTVCIEIACLQGLNNEDQVLAMFEQQAVDLGATVHWGQLNHRTVADIEAAFPGKIDRWRAVLARVSVGGSLATFDNDYCMLRGLEAGAMRPNQGLGFLGPLLHQATAPDLSFLTPILLQGCASSRDISYLQPLLLHPAHVDLSYLRPLLLSGRNDATPDLSYLIPTLLSR